MTKIKLATYRDMLKQSFMLFIFYSYGVCTLLNRIGAKIECQSTESKVIDDIW